MKFCLLLTSVGLCALVACAQGTSPSSTGSSTASGSSASSGLKVRGPEAVAQQEPNRIVAVINGKQITAKDAADMLKAIPAEQRKQYESNLPSVLQQIYMSQQLADEAAKMNLDQQSPWKEQIKLNRDQILTRAYLNQMATKNASAPSVDPQQYYNGHPEEFDQAKLSGIFVAFNPPGTPATGAANSRTEEQARDKATEVEKKLKAGGDFAALARTESDNQQAAARGGELGTFSMGDANLPPDVRTALQKLQPGQTSEPIRVPNAYLIVKMDSRNKLTFEQAKAGIVQKQQTDKNQAVVKQELDKYKIQVQDPDFFNSSTASNVPSLQRPGAASAPATKPPSQK